MKYLLFFTITFLVCGCKESTQTLNKSVPLTVVEQDYDKAFKLASNANKLLLIDFYTSWCAPCKKIDKVVFQNDSITELLGKDFVLLKYDAENDTIHHLSKKHHVSSYPTGLILSKEGYVLNRKYGYAGDDSEALQRSFLEFTNASLALNEENRILEGYSNKINHRLYPTFYIDYVNRTNTKIDTSQLSDYLSNTNDKFSEAYFSTLMYFGQDAPASIADLVLANKQKYLELYGKLDVEILLYFLASGKFSNAILENSQEKYNKAIEYTKSVFSDKELTDILARFEIEYLKAQNRWEEVFEINKKLKDAGEFDNGYINYFSWQVYEKCDDQDVIVKCLEWMKSVTKEEPIYAYLDTYAHLMSKTENKEETRRIAKMAIKAAEKENVSAKTLKELLE